MKICGISDLHGYLPNNIPICDVLCVCGDIIPLKMQRNLPQSRKWWLEDFCSWVARLPCEKVIFTAGNHDFFLEDLYKNKLGDYYEFTDKLKENSNGKAILLIEEVYKYNDVTFYGFPYITPITFQEKKWAFEDSYQGKEEPSEYDELKDLNVDVIITHDNPFKNHKLTAYLTNKPKYWFYGHWHNGPEDKSINYYNCSILNDLYSLKDNFELPMVEFDMKKDIIKEIFTIMINNIPAYTALKGYDNFQVNAIKEYLKLNMDFFLRDSEDDTPLPVTAEVIEENGKDEN